LAQWQELVGIQREITALKPRADAAAKQREQDRRRAQQNAAVVRLRTERPALVGLLDELTRTLPSNSWLTALSVAGRDVLLEGLSPSAAKLALTLANNPVFATAAFRAPISRDPVSGLERFQLAITIGAPPQ